MALDYSVHILPYLYDAPSYDFQMKHYLYHSRAGQV